MEAFSGGGEENGAIAAFEQWQAEGIFERTDLAADGTVGHEQMVGGAGEAQLVGGDVENVEGIKG